MTRTRSEEDERVLIAAITPKGEDLKDEAVLIPQKMMACAALPQEKAAQLYTLLYELLNTLEKIESKLKKGGKRIATAFPVRNCAGVPALNHKASVINRHEQPED